VLQEAPPEWPVLRPHRLAIGLYDRGPEGLSHRHRVELDVTGNRTEVPDLVGQRAADLVLVNDDDLTYARIRLDPRSLETVTAHLGELPDSLPRALCWGACWDMVRDAEMPTRAFLDLVLANVHAEDEIGMVQRVVGQLEGAIDVYGDPANAEAAWGSLAAAALQEIERAEPGSDFQLAWTRTFADAARSDDHLALARRLLDGSATYEGLTVDTELRWHLVSSLAAAGVPDAADLVRVEMERDPTDQGRRHAAAALASRPSEEAKREAWERITGDPDLTTATLSALMRGFQRPGQTELLRPYVDPYFEALWPIWRDRSLEFGLSFARGMYPGNVVEEALVERTDRYLEEGSPPGPVRRTLIEGRDGVVRALRARARDAGGLGGS
jgi:aminopeptidase N